MCFVHNMGKSATMAVKIKEITVKLVKNIYFSKGIDKWKIV